MFKPDLFLPGDLLIYTIISTHYFLVLDFCSSTKTTKVFSWKDMKILSFRVRKIEIGDTLYPLSRTRGNKTSELTGLHFDQFFQPDKK